LAGFQKKKSSFITELVSNVLKLICVSTGTAS